MDIDTRLLSYRTWTPDRHHARTTAWIYRNLPGARIYRRCHHLIVVPRFPIPNVVKYGLSGLDVDEVTEAGIGARLGSYKRDLRYIQWLTQDMEDFPSDSRSIYYRAHSHINLFKQMGEDPNHNRTERAYHLQRAIDDFEARTRINYFPQEAWMAHLLLQEIHMSIRVNETRALIETNNLYMLDPARGEPFFEFGRWYFYSLNNHTEGLKYLSKVVEKFQMEPRDHFQWPEMWSCLRYVEYATMVLKSSPPPEERHIKSALTNIKKVRQTNKTVERKWSVYLVRILLLCH